MIKINLLPHRALKRAARRRDFYIMLGLSFASAAVLVFAVGFVINGYISDQDTRNTYIRAKNAELDQQIKEIANLQQEIASLRARQTAVENLQSDRNLPVHLLDELVRHVPEGVYLRTVRQNNMRVFLNGHAQSNERVSELLRNLGNNSPWLERPELVEIRLVNVAGRQLYEFGLNVTMRRPPANAKTEPAKSASAVPAQTGVNRG